MTAAWPSRGPKSIRLFRSITEDCWLSFPSRSLWILWDIVRYMRDSGMVMSWDLAIWLHWCIALWDSWFNPVGTAWLTVWWIASTTSTSHLMTSEAWKQVCNTNNACYLPARPLCFYMGFCLLNLSIFSSRLFMEGKALNRNTECETWVLRLFPRLKFYRPYTSHLIVLWGTLKYIGGHFPYTDSRPLKHALWEITVAVKGKINCIH